MTKKPRGSCTPCWQRSTVRVAAVAEVTGPRTSRYLCRAHIIQAIQDPAARLWESTVEFLEPTDRTSDYRLRRLRRVDLYRGMSVSWVGDPDASVQIGTVADPAVPTVLFVGEKTPRRVHIEDLRRVRT